MADFTFYGGLYRDVNIIAVNETHFDLDYYGGTGIKVTPCVKEKAALVEVETFITNLQSGDKIRYTLCDKEGNAVAEALSEETKQALTIENVRIWNGRKDPYLYTAKAEIVRGEQTIDNVSARFSGQAQLAGYLR